MTEATPEGSRYDGWKRRGVIAWAVLGILAVLYVGMRALGVVWPAVELLLAGVIIGFVCSPITNWLERHGVPRGVAALMALLVLVVVVVAVCALIIPPTIEQIVELLRRVPLYVTQIQGALGHFWSTYGSSDNQQAQNIINTLVGSASSAGTELASETMNKLTSGVVTNLTNTVSGFVTVCLGLVVGYWLAKDYPAMARELAVIVGPEHEQSTTMLLAVVSRSMGGYMRGIVITSVVNGVGSYLALLAIGHPYASLMGITCGLFHFVPVIGPWAAVLLAAAIALFSSPWLALWTLVLTVVVMNVTDNVVSPLVMQSAVKVHPALSLLGIVVGNALGGILGMALAIPLTAAIRSAFVYFFEVRSGRQLVSYDGAIFKSTPYVDEAGEIQPTFDALDDPQFFESTMLVRPDGMHAVHAEERPAREHSSLADRIGSWARSARSRARHPLRGAGASGPLGSQAGAEGTTMGHAKQRKQDRDNRESDGGDQ